MIEERLNSTQNGPLITKVKMKWTEEGAEGTFERKWMGIELKNVLVKYEPPKDGEILESVRVLDKSGSLLNRDYGDRLELTYKQASWAEKIDRWVDRNILPFFL